MYVDHQLMLAGVGRSRAQAARAAREEVNCNLPL